MFRLEPSGPHGAELRRQIYRWVDLQDLEVGSSGTLRLMCRLWPLLAPLQQDAIFEGVFAGWRDVRLPRLVEPERLGGPCPQKTGQVAAIWAGSAVELAKTEGGTWQDEDFWPFWPGEFLELPAGFLMTLLALHRLSCLTPNMFLFLCQKTKNLKLENNLSQFSFQTV